MKLSIVVPVYNMSADDKLTFCLDSLVNQQNMDEYEIICVDDVSTDDSVKILKEYQEKYPDKIKVILHTQNLRQGGARNTGMKAATGEWLGFMDSDDWADPFMFSKMLQKAEETGADVVGCDYQMVSRHCFEKGKYVQNNFDDQTGIMNEETKRQLCLKAGSMVVKIYKRDVLVSKNLTFPEKMFYEDNAEAPIWMMSFSHFERVGEAFYYYYQHETSTVHVVNPDKLLDRIKAGEILLQEAKERGFFENCQEELVFKYLELAYANTLFSYAQQKMDTAFLKEMQKRIVKTLASLQRKKDLEAELSKDKEEIDEHHVKQLEKELKGISSKEKDIYNAYLCMMTNKYYKSGFDVEQKKFLEMFLQSPAKMKLHYELLMLYRKLRYRK